MSDKAQRVHAIGLDKDKNFILTKQYRYPIKTVVIDVAGGVPEQNESTQQAAEREFFEETGYKGQKIIHLGKCSIEQAKADYWLYEYLILDCSQKGKIHGGEKVEETEVFKLPVNKAWNYIKNNRIVSCHSISTITKALLYLQIKK
ncbi:NUDIX domain-containing protein [Candidatus Dojkabacteria bacterium]|nr:NUDIX domain-containing protein [Candidatus Dojkabacteria bacterium]